MKLFKKILSITMFSFCLINLFACTQITPPIDVEDETTCKHEYVEHYGITDCLKEKGIISYYTCSKCTAIFDTDKKYAGEDLVINFKEMKKSNTLLFVIGHSIDIKYNEKTYDTAIELFHKLQASLKEGVKEYTAIDEEYTQMMDIYYDMCNSYVYTNMAGDMYNKEEYFTLSEEILEKTTLVENEFWQLDLDFYHSKYKNDYYSDMTNEEIEEYVAGIDIEKIAKSNALQVELKKITNAYSTDEEADLAKYFNDYKKVANELAENEGYTTYLAYAYKETYGRDYDESNVLELREYIKDYIVPLYNKYEAQFINYQENGNPTYYNAFVDYYLSSLVKEFNNLTKYAELIGGQYLESFNNLWESGNFFFSRFANDNATAYQTSTYNPDQGIMFFSPEYQTTSTFVHEFGHLNANVSNTIHSYDLFETQSQANELLYSVFLQNNKILASAAAKMYQCYSVYSMLSSVVFSYLTGYVETKAYESANEFTVQELQKIWDDECTYLGVTDAIGNNYWSYGIINAPGYYISYSTSAVASLEVFAFAKSDFSNGIEIYKNIYSYPEEIETFTGVLEHAGLYSVFTKECYQFLAEKL